MPLVKFVLEVCRGLNPYFKQKGRDHNDALDKIHKKYGDKVQILTHKSVAAPGLLGLFGKEYVEYSGYILSAKDSIRVDNERDEENRAAILASTGKDNLITQKYPSVADSSKDQVDMRVVIEEIRSLKGQFPSSISSLEQFPVLGELSEILQDNDFEKGYIDKLIQQLRNTFTAVDLEKRSKVHNHVAAMISGRISFFSPDTNPHSRISVLIGPTGVGKTTTIAKMAAVCKYSKNIQKIRIITLDNFRIGALQQIEKYAEIMAMPIKAISDYDALKKEISCADEDELIFIDTTGKSPRDNGKIEEMRDLILACGPDATLYLTVSATTKSADLRDILKRFDCFDYQSVIITKLDETSRIGNILSVLSDIGVSVSYITDGQSSVPAYITQASADHLMKLVKGLDFDLSAIDARYPLDESHQHKGGENNA